MKKPIIIIILILLAIIGCTGIIYATGNFDKIVGKVFNRSEIKKDFGDRLKFCEEQENEDEKFVCYMKVGKDYPDRISEVCSMIKYRKDSLRIFSEWASTEFEISIEDFLETKQLIARDIKRKSDLSQIMLALDMCNSDFDKYPVSKGLEKIQDESCVLRENLKSMIFEMPPDPLNPEFYYGYKSDGITYELTARLENLEDGSCVTQNEVCLYKCKDGVCGDTEKHERDAIRETDIGQIILALETFYTDIKAYAQKGGVANMPLSIGEIMVEVPKDPLSNKGYGWIDNTKDSSKFCVYAKLEQGRYYAGSHKGMRVLNLPPKNLSCW
jgi:hypothetical protein